MSPVHPYTRTGVDYALQSLQPFGEWEQSTSYQEDLDDMREWLETRRQNRPDQQHRLIRRTTTITVEVMEEP